MLLLVPPLVVVKELPFLFRMDKILLVVVVDISPSLGFAVEDPIVMIMVAGDDDDDDDDDHDDTLRRVAVCRTNAKDVADADVDADADATGTNHAAAAASITDDDIFILLYYSNGRDVWLIRY